jgi:hypothetical protein
MERAKGAREPTRRQRKPIGADCVTPGINRAGQLPATTRRMSMREESTVITLPDDLIKKCDDWAQAVWAEAMSSESGYTEIESGCRRFHNPALERVSRHHEHFLCYQIDGLPWAIELLTSLLDEQRAHDASMAVGYGRALEYAIKHLEAELADVAAGELAEIDKELRDADLSPDWRASYQKRREAMAAIVQAHRERMAARAAR